VDAGTFYGAKIKNNIYGSATRYWYLVRGSLALSVFLLLGGSSDACWYSLLRSRHVARSTALRAPVLYAEPAWPFFLLSVFSSVRCAIEISSKSNSAVGLRVIKVTRTTMQERRRDRLLDDDISSLLVLAANNKRIIREPHRKRGSNRASQRTSEMLRRRGCPDAKQLSNLGRHHQRDLARSLPFWPTTSNTSPRLAKQSKNHPGRP